MSRIATIISMERLSLQIELI